jgi:hypothetical protein
VYCTVKKILFCIGQGYRKKKTNKVCANLVKFLFSKAFVFAYLLPETKFNFFQIWRKYKSNLEVSKNDPSEGRAKGMCFIMCFVQSVA